MQRFSTKGLRYFLTFFLFFAAHRFLSFSILSKPLLPSTKVYVQAFAVGLASDLWVSGVACILALGLDWLLSLLGGGSKSRKRSLRRDGSPIFYILVSLLLAVVLSVHQSYVEHFHVPLVPFHLSYLWDYGFVSSKYRAALSQKSILSLLLFCVILFILVKTRIFATLRLKHSIISLLSILLFAVLAHLWNSHYGTRWFVPESVRLNVFEAFRAQKENQRLPVPLGEEDLDRLALKLKRPKGQNLEELLVLSLGEQFSEDLVRKHPGSLAVALHKEWQELLEAGRKPLLLTLVLESFRAVDSASYGGTRRSLTPHFDQLVQQGIFFKDAWSVGTVARGAQEAIWCGYLASAATSSMRHRSEVQLTCLPDLKAKQSFWYHGGEARFDSQLRFWQAHGVADSLVSDSFSENVARTSLGVGDISFLRETFKRILQRDRESKEGYQFGMALTVTNQSPWEIPEDAPSTMDDAPFFGQDPSENTLFYSDYALGEFVTSLKLSGLWDKTLLVLVGDRGSDLPALQDDLHDIENSPEQRLGKIAMALSGGIVERLKEASFDKSQFVREETVSQVDIAPFLAFVLGIHGPRFLGETLLLRPRLRPVVTDLGSTVHFPQLKQTLSLSQILNQDLGEISDDQLRFAATYYRGVLELINEWSAHDRALVQQER